MPMKFLAEAPKLRANLETGEGEIRVPLEFEELDPLMQCDLLKDWSYDLDKEYWAARERWAAQYPEKDKR